VKGSSRPGPGQRLVRFYAVLGFIIGVFLVVLIFLPDFRSDPSQEDLETIPVPLSEARDHYAEHDKKSGTDRNMDRNTEQGTEPDGRPLENGTSRREDPYNNDPANGVPRPGSAGRLYIVIDDAGYSLSDLENFLSFPGALTIAVLPHLRYSRETAARVQEAGQDVLLHLPMEPESGLDPGPGAILVSQSEDEIRKAVRAAIQSVPGAIGANNHMGSRATANVRVMETVLSQLSDHNLFFLDSRTTPETLAARVAEQTGIHVMERDVFLDNEPDKDAIREAFIQGMQVAADKGHAVMIGHLMVSELAEVLAEVYPFVLEEGFDLYHLSDLLPSRDEYEDPWD
jgi:polysaccharide deacetylase 2 family uncharacterized protein YibQ